MSSATNCFTEGNVRLFLETGSVDLKCGTWIVLVEKQADSLFYGDVSCILLLLKVVLVETIIYSGIFRNESVDKDVI